MLAVFGCCYMLTPAGLGSDVCEQFCVVSEKRVRPGERADTGGAWSRRPRTRRPPQLRVSPRGAGWVFYSPKAACEALRLFNMSGPCGIMVALCC